MPRKTRDDVRFEVAQLARETGLDIVAEWAYDAGIRLTYRNGSVNLSPRLRTGEMMLWISAFQQGYRTRVQKEPVVEQPAPHVEEILEQAFRDGLECDTCKAHLVVPGNTDPGARAAIAWHEWVVKYGTAEIDGVLGFTCPHCPKASFFPSEELRLHNIHYKDHHDRVTAAMGGN